MLRVCSGRAKRQFERENRAPLSAAATGAERQRTASGGRRTAERNTPRDGICSEKTSMNLLISFITFIWLPLYRLSTLTSSSAINSRPEITFTVAHHFCGERFIPVSARSGRRRMIIEIREPFRTFIFHFLLIYSIDINTRITASQFERKTSQVT